MAFLKIPRNLGPERGSMIDFIQLNTETSENEIGAIADGSGSLFLSADEAYTLMQRGAIPYISIGFSDQVEVSQVTVTDPDSITQSTTHIRIHHESEGVEDVKIGNEVNPVAIIQSLFQ